MVIKAEIEINVPSNVVRQTVSPMEDGDDQNTACRSCCIASGDASISAAQTCST